MRWILQAGTLLTIGALWACGDTAGIENGGTIGIRFDGSPSSAGTTAGLGSAAASVIDILGNNGTLTIDDVRLIIRKFEVDRVDDDCGEEADSTHRSGSNDDEHCEKFRAPPSFVSLPLEGEGALVVELVVPPGLYDELELEIEEIDDDDNDGGLRDRLMRELMVVVRSEFPEWPREASVRVAGAFTPTGGSARSFIAYFDAEIEIELALRPPLLIGSDDSPVVTVAVDPAMWFSRADGRVIDLSAYDFQRTGHVAEFEIEIDKGFVKMRFDR